MSQEPFLVRNGSNYGECALNDVFVYRKKITQYTALLIRQGVVFISPRVKTRPFTSVSISELLKEDP